MKRHLFIISFLVSFIAVKAQNNNLGDNNKIRSEADVLNDEALKTARSVCNKDSLWKAIKLFEQAIALDSSIFIFYSNEAATYCDLGNYEGVINVLNRYLYNFPINISMEIFKGFIFEKMGNADSAMSCYSKGMEHLNAKIKNDSNNISILVNRAFVLFFTKGNKDARSGFNRIKKKFPNNKTVKFMQEDFDSFDRKTYINQIFSSCLFPDPDEKSDSSTIYLTPRN